MSKVTVLMNCYNGERFVRESIESVFQQTFQDWELVFIDNCSTDRTAEIAQSFKDPRLRYHRTPQFMSLCQARVWARPLIQGEYFSALDSDDLLLPQKLEKQVAVLDRLPEVGLVYCNSEFFTAEGKRTTYYSRPMPSGDLFRPLLASYFLSFETLMARRSVMDQHQIYFDPRYNIASDAELYIKLSYYTKAHYIDEVLAKWRYGHVSESVKQALSFPQEFETLLSDLAERIPHFESTYASEVHTLRSRIQNMYGLGYWQQGDRRRARQHFKQAAQQNPKYFLPLTLMHLLSFPAYQKLRRLIVKA